MNGFGAFFKYTHPLFTKRYKDSAAFKFFQEQLACLIQGLFVYNGDTYILNALIRYGSRAYGFPGEYLSYQFVDMFLMRPKVFVATLAVKDDPIVNTVTNALIFGIRNNQVREKVEEVLRKDLSSMEAPGKRVVILLTEKIEH